jgi:hypothetical protein
LWAIKNPCRDVRARRVLSRVRKAENSFFLLLFSGYQVEGINLPNLFGLFGWEMVCNEGEHFGTVPGKLDKFSTLEGFGRAGAEARFLFGFFAARLQAVPLHFDVPLFGAGADREAQGLKPGS